MKFSVVIRALNEAKHLPDLIAGIHRQELDGHEVEVVLVDSGSTDATVTIARNGGARVVHIKKEDFTFGRSLNIGCAAAEGEVLVFISGHCVPIGNRWLLDLTRPILSGVACYAYGGQLAGGHSKYSEGRLLAKYFPNRDAIPQSGFYANNANSALMRSVWESCRFDETLTGLEDMELAKRLVNAGHTVAYCASARVYHYHDESWSQVRRRYERESIALQTIMPEIHISPWDLVRFIVSAVAADLGNAWREDVLLRVLPEIVMFRLMQYWGAYKGNHEHRKLSHERKYKYFYPR